MTEREACLVDVYDTLLNCDFEGHGTELPALAGVTAEAWAEGYRTIGAATGVGRLSTAEGYAQILRASGTEPRPDLVRALVDLDRELLLRYARLYDDAIPFLRTLRSRGIKPSYCAGAADLGITAVQIVRGEPDGKVPAAGTRAVRSLLEVQALF